MAARRRTDNHSVELGDNRAPGQWGEAPVARVWRVLAAEPVTITPLDGDEARAVGQVCGATGTSDIADASVVVLARRVHGVVVTSDPHDLHRIDPGLDLAQC